MGSAASLSQPIADKRALSGNWKVSPDEVQTAAKEAWSEYGTRDKCVVYLLSKGVMRQKDKEAVRKEFFKSMCEPKDGCSVVRRRRLEMSIAQLCDKTFDIVPQGWQQFSEFRLRRCALMFDDAFIFPHRKRSVVGTAARTSSWSVLPQRTDRVAALSGSPPPT